MSNEHLNISKLTFIQIISLEKKLDSKLDQPETLPKFEFLRSEHHSDLGDTYDNADRVGEERGKQSGVPFKRINKKLTDMMTEIQTRNDQVRGQISDFRLVFSEQSQEQAIVLQNFAKNFAGLEQLCGEHSREFSRYQSNSKMMNLKTLTLMFTFRFSTSMSPTLERIDRWTASWQSQATQKSCRV